MTPVPQVPAARLTPERYQRVREVFHGAWERPPGERTAFLDGACGDDAQLRAQVEALLAAGQRDGEFMSRTAADTVDGDGLLWRPGQSGPAPTPIPEAIGRFRIIRLLGEGGMGAAYEAQQENPSRRVAVKTIRPGLGTPAILRRFAYEAQILGRLRHPGIAQVYEAGVAEGPAAPIPFIAMELVAGVSLDEWAKREKPSRRERISLLAKVCDAVQHAHGNSVVHRDLKPGNILVEASGPGPMRVSTPKVLDFGVARLLDPGPAGTPVASLATDPGTLIGTLAYMSPEQVSGNTEGVDARADIYALGVILFELLTGKLPRDTDGKPIAEAARIIRDEEPLRAVAVDRSLRGDLDTICAKAMERDPARRYQTAAELGTDLLRFLGDEPIIARPATVLYQMRKFARRHRGLVAGLAAAGAALLLGIVGTVWYAVLADRERTRALEQEAASRWTSYRLTIAAAEEGVRTEPGRTRTQLAAVPKDQRKWEWRHFMARLESSAQAVEGDAEVIAGAAFTPEGSPRTAVARNGNALILDPATGAQIESLPVPSGVSAMVLSADAKMLAAFGRQTGEVIVFDAVNHTRVAINSFQGLEILALGISPDHSRLGVVVKGKGLFVIDAKTGERLGASEFAVASAGYGVVEFSPDNSKLLCSAVSMESTWVHMYDAAGALTSRSVDQATVAVFDPTARVIASAVIGGIRLRDGDSLALLNTIHGRFREAYALSFSGDGMRLAGYVGKKTIAVWTPATGVMERAITAPDTTLGIAMDRAGERVLAVSVNRVTLLPLTDQGVKVLAGNTSYVYSVAWSTDGRSVASAGWDGSVRIWDAATGDLKAALPVQPIEPLAPVSAIAFAAESADLLVMTHAGELLRFDGANFTRMESVATPAADDAKRSEVEARYWREARPGAKRVYQIGGERDCSSPRGDLLARVEDNYFVAISKREDGKEVLRFRAHDSSLKATAFSPDGRLLVTGAENGAIRIWDARSGSMIVELGEHQSPVYTLSFNPDGSRMVSGDGDGLIFVWDTVRNEKIAELRGHTSYVHSLAFSPDGNTLCSGSGDGTVRLWRTVK